MPICEVLPRWSIGPVRIGTKLGPPLEDPTVSIVLRDYTSPFDLMRGYKDLIIAKVLRPEEVVISRCNGVTYSPFITIVGADINEYPLTRGRLRWVSGF